MTEQLMKEMLYWKNKAGELALRVLELENNQSQQVMESGNTSRAKVISSKLPDALLNPADTSTKQELNKEIAKDWVKEKREFGKQRLESAIRNDAISVYPEQEVKA